MCSSRGAATVKQPWLARVCNKFCSVLTHGVAWQKLPTQLIAAFQATLEEIESSTLLMHIVDVSHPNAAAQSASVLSVGPLSGQATSLLLVAIVRS